MPKTVAISALLLLAGGALSAQDPRTLPRVQAGDVVKVGTFRLPPEVGLPNALAIDGTTLYVGCYLRNPNPQRDSVAGVATLLLPEIDGEATLVEPCQPLPNRNHLHRTGVYENVIPGGILPWRGRLVVSGSDYYDGSGGQWKSHWAGANASTLAGPFTVSVPDLPKFSDGQPPTVFWDRSAFVSGFMGVIPPAWRGLLGGPALTGNCCLPIISRTSYGPSVSVFDPAEVGVVDPVPSKMLVGYPIEHRTLGDWDAKPPGTYYGGSDQLGGVAFPSGTRSILFTGRHGESWCYGPATADKALVGTIYGDDSLPRCYDPTDLLRGNHGTPYIPTVWAYDAAELVAVKEGAKEPWEPVPYAKWTLPGMPIDGATNLLRAGTYDDATRRLYVASTDAAVVHVFAIGAGGGPPP